MRKIKKGSAFCQLISSNDSELQVFESFRFPRKDSGTKKIINNKSAINTIVA